MIIIFILAKNKDAVSKLLKGGSLENVLEDSSAEVVKLQASN